MAEDKRTPERKRSDAAWVARHDVPMTPATSESRTKIVHTKHGAVKTTETRKK